MQKFYWSVNLIIILLSFCLKNQVLLFWSWVSISGPAITVSVHLDHPSWFSNSIRGASSPSLHQPVTGPLRTTRPFRNGWNLRKIIKDIFKEQAMASSFSRILSSRRNVGLLSLVGGSVAAGFLLRRERVTAGEPLRRRYPAR